MKTIVGAVTGLIFSVSWIVWGFGLALAIILTSALFALIGYTIELTAFSGKKLISQLKTKLAE